VVAWLACPDDQRQVAQVRAERPPLPDVTRLARLVKLKVDRDHLKGQLLLPTDPAVPLEASFGLDRLELARRSPSPLLPCAGVVLVPQSAVRPDWSGVELTPSQTAELERLAVQLYRMLLAGRFDREDEDGERVRDLLADAVLRLQLAAVQAGGHLKGEAGVLLRDLKQIPLVRRGDKRVRLDKLLRSRPADLEQLGLWPTKPRPAAAPGAEVAAPDSPEAASAAAAPSSTVEVAPPPAPLAWPQVPVPETAEAREGRFLGRLAEELQRVWPKEDRRNVRFEALVLVDEGGEQPARYGPDLVAVQRRHALVRAALAAFEEDPVPLWLLVSTIATQANLAFTRITDEHERAMQLALVERLAEGAGPATN
jgi:hypothetical protein